MDELQPGPTPLAGPAVRPLLITVIITLRPDLDVVAVGGAVEQIALAGEQALDTVTLCQDAVITLTLLDRSTQA